MYFKSLGNCKIGILFITLQCFVCLGINYFVLSNANARVRWKKPPLLFSRIDVNCISFTFQLSSQWLRHSAYSLFPKVRQIAGELTYTISHLSQPPHPFLTSYSAQPTVPSLTHLTHLLSHRSVPSNTQLSHCKVRSFLLEQTSHWLACCLPLPSNLPGHCLHRHSHN